MASGLGNPNGGSPADSTPSSDGFPGAPTQTEFTYNATEGQFVIIFGAFMSALATVSVIARLYSRYFIAKHVGLDDFMAIGSLVRTILLLPWVLLFPPTSVANIFDSVPRSS